MQIVTKIRKRSFNIGKVSFKSYKQHAHRVFRHNVKIAVNCEHEIDWKPRLTGWDFY